MFCCEFEQLSPVAGSLCLVSVFSKYIRFNQHGLSKTRAAESVEIGKALPGKSYMLAGN